MNTTEFRERIVMAQQQTSTKTLAEQAANALGIDITVTHRRASHYADETREAYWLTRADLRYALDCATNPTTRDDAYSHWCAGTGRLMSTRARRAIYGR